MNQIIMIYDIIIRLNNKKYLIYHNMKTYINTIKKSFLGIEFLFSSLQKEFLKLCFNLYHSPK